MQYQYHDLGSAQGRDPWPWTLQFYQFNEVAEWRDTHFFGTSIKPFRCRSCDEMMSLWWIMIIRHKYGIYICIFTWKFICYISNSLIFRSRIVYRISNLAAAQSAGLRSRFPVRPSSRLQEERPLESRISRLILTFSPRGFVFPRADSKSVAWKLKNRILLWAHHIPIVNF